MKKLLLLLITVTAISCNSDDNSTPVNANPQYAGHWREVSYTAVGMNTVLLDNCAVNSTGHIMEFKAGGQLEIHPACENATFQTHYTANYAIEGDVLTITNQSPSAQQVFHARYFEGTYDVEFIDATTMMITRTWNEYNTNIGDYTILHKQ